jgi:hypothetical protein
MRKSRPPKQTKTTPQVCQALTVKWDKKVSCKFLLWPSYRERAVPSPARRLHHARESRRRQGPPSHPQQRGLAREEPRWKTTRRAWLDASQPDSMIRAKGSGNDAAC